MALVHNFLGDKVSSRKHFVDRTRSRMRKRASARNQGDLILCGVYVGPCWLPHIDEFAVGSYYCALGAQKDDRVAWIEVVPLREINETHAF